MDTFENNQQPIENENIQPRAESTVAEQTAHTASVPQTESTSTAYHGVGAGHKESPFADSPYVMNHQSAYQQPGNVYESAVPKKTKTIKKRSVWKAVVASVLVLVLVVSSCAVTAFIVDEKWEDRTEQIVEKFNDKIEDLQQQINDNSYTGNGNSVSGSPTVTDGLTPSQLYAQHVKSVVAITNTIVTTSFGQVVESTGSGSGFILTEDGYVVTNYHVVEGATKLTVTIHDGTEYEATLIGYVDNNDLALLKIEATGLQFAKLGSSSDLIVGDQVVAIGNPLGTLTSTLTVGYISAKDRDVTTDGTVINMLQTDCAINSGNSGGPLFNMKGEVIGITTAKYSGSTTSGATIEGIGFAIPIDDIADMITELMENGYVSSPYMGVYVRDTSEGIGAYVDSVEADGSAAAAGVQAGDIIVELGGYEITSTADLSKALRDFEVGDTTTIKVYRNRTVVEMSITFAQRPYETATGSDAPSGGETSNDESDVPSNGTYEDWFAHFFGGNG